MARIPDSELERLRRTFGTGNRIWGVWKRSRPVARWEDE